MLHTGQPAYTDSSGYVQKWAAHRIIRGLVRAAGKPSDEPLRKGETQSPTDQPPSQSYMHDQRTGRFIRKMTVGKMRMELIARRVHGIAQNCRAGSWNRVEFDRFACLCVEVR